MNGGLGRWPPQPNAGAPWARAVLVLIAVLGACSDPAPAPAPQAGASGAVDPATAGTIVVDVQYEGVLPPAAEVNMRSAPQCAAAHAQPVRDQSLLVRDGRLQNVVVWIKEGLQGRRFAAPSEPVVVDQKGCVYEPRVVATMVSQPVKFINSDPEAHNVHGHPRIVSGWNFMMSRQGSARTLSFDKPEIAIPVGCDIHPWMRAYVAVVEHPYFAVTAEGGTATLQNVPPGEYVVAAWHETLGVKEQPVTLPPNGSTRVEFAYASDT